MEVSEIKAALPRKGVKRIARKTGLSHSTVSLVLSGQRKNTRVIDAALEVIEEEKTAEANRNQRFKELLS